MHFTEFVEVDVGSWDDFNFSNLDVLDGIDGWDFFGDFLFNGFTGEEVEDLGDISFANLFGNDVIDSFSDDLLLRAEGVVGFSFLVGGFSGEGDHEDSEEISILRFDFTDGFNECFSLLDKRAEFISGGVDTIEWGDCVSSLGLINDEFDFSPMEGVLVGGQISLHLSYNSSLDAVFDFSWMIWGLLRPWVLLAQVYPNDSDWNGAGAFN